MESPDAKLLTNAEREELASAEPQLLFNLASKACEVNKMEGCFI